MPLTRLDAVLKPASVITGQYPPAPPVKPSAGVIRSDILLRYETQTHIHFQQTHTPEHLHDTHTHTFHLDTRALDLNVLVPAVTGAVDIAKPPYFL